MSRPKGGETRVVSALSNRRAPDLKVIRILLVDDDPQAQALIDMALADAPFERNIEVVGTASAGIVRIEANEHDIYLIDQQLPDGTGIELIRRAKAGTTSKPFILMTGYGSGDIDDAASIAGAVDYVEKHMVAAQLERSIRYALRNWHAGRMLHDRDEQLRQAQKMEAIGRLAGGVAHDFNNLLTAIIGYTDLIAERVDIGDQTARDVSEIRKAADRAAALTRQLLSFSRKQFLNPTIVNLNDIASGLLQMLPRVIGDHIQTTSYLGEGLARVKADASQMEQVFINLVLNARDAMPMGGHLTIRTANLALDEERLVAEALSLSPGAYAMLSVGDTGTGMDAATRDRAFEPFFTTKPKGKGTGLGLATVYGIVDQSGGGIYLDTAPGRGTTVRVYLPVTNAVQEPRKPEIAVGTRRRRHRNAAARRGQRRRSRAVGQGAAKTRLYGPRSPQRRGGARLDDERWHQSAPSRHGCGNAWGQRPKSRHAADAAEPESARAVRLGLFRRCQRPARGVLSPNPVAAEAVHAKQAGGADSNDPRHEGRPIGDGSLSESSTD